MKIAQVCPYDIDRPGGVQKHIRDTAMALQELGHQVIIVAPAISTEKQKPDRTAVGGVTIARFGRARKIRFGGTNYEIAIALGEERQRLAAFLREQSFDVIHFHTMWTPMLSFQIFRLSKSVNIGTFHDTPAATVTGRILYQIFRLLSRWLLPRLDGVTTVSDAPLEHLRAACRTDIQIIPPCTDLKRFSTSGISKRRFSDERLNILFLGRIDRRKGAMLLLEAYEQLCSEGLPIRLLIAGTGDDADLLHQYVIENALPHVEFLGAFKDEDAVSIYAECDIFCAPSPYGESFGIVVAEAMASGKPVVAAANRGYRNLLTGKAARFLTPPGDSTALGDALLKLIKDSALRRELGDWGRNEALKYDCRTIAPRFVEIYEKAINARQSVISR